MREQSSAFAEMTLRPETDAASTSEVQTNLIVEDVDADRLCQLEAGAYLRYTLVSHQSPLIGRLVL